MAERPHIRPNRFRGWLVFPGHLGVPTPAAPSALCDSSCSTTAQLLLVLVCVGGKVKPGGIQIASRSEIGLFVATMKVQAGCCAQASQACALMPGVAGGTECGSTLRLVSTCACKI